MKEINKRTCKKCLIRDSVSKEDLYRILKERIDAINDTDRTEDSLYERRLNTCLDCDYFSEGMCKACGCYIELRAAVSSNKCPYGRW